MAQQTPASKKTTSAKQTAAHRAADMAAAKRHQMQGINPDERHRMITEAAYLIAEKRGFQGDMAMEDWLQAEAEVDSRYSGVH